MRLLVLDSEATGINAFTERLVTVFIGIMEDNGEFSEKHNWLFNPGIEIPEAAANVHGITTEVAVRDGIQENQKTEAFLRMRSIIIDNIRDHNFPVVAYNTAYDFTLINAEFIRNNVSPINWDDLFVLDPMVIDKQIDKFRRGGRTLVDVAAHYNVPVDPEKAHEAEYDCLLAGRVLQALTASSHLSGLSRSELHKSQKAWKAEQALGLQNYFRKKNNDNSIIINGEWPVQLTPTS
jgi:DNA polymerase-3 subunit epsilon